MICGIIAVGLLFAAFRLCTRPPRPPAAVQMTGPPAQAPYYTGSAAYGPTPPPQGAGYYGGAWGTQPGPAGYPPAAPGAGGYGYAGGYGQPPPTQPQHTPPPMQTVVLGAPTESGGVATGTPSGNPFAPSVSGPAGLAAGASGAQLLPPSTGAGGGAAGGAAAAGDSSAKV